MRMMRTETSLLEKDYVVASGPLHERKKLFGAKFGAKCLPIKFTVLECFTRSRPTANIAELVCDENGWGMGLRPITEKYKEVLCGTNHDWYLYQFTVTNCSLRLGFYNPKEHCPDYILFDETTAYEAFALEVKFDVPRLNGGSKQYLISLHCSPHLPRTDREAYSVAKVTEYHQDSIIKIEFTRDGGKFEEGHVIVTEYVDL